MYDVSQAEEIRDEQSQIIGYIKEIAAGLWLPIDIELERIAGPTHKQDAITIVRINKIEKINT